MAVINGITTAVQHSVLETQWTGLGTADTGTPEQLARYPIHSVQVGGVFGGATVVMEGSDDGVTYFTLTGESPTGGGDVLVSATSATRFDIPNVVPRDVRPRTSGGSGLTSINVIMTSRSYGH